MKHSNTILYTIVILITILLSITNTFRSGVLFFGLFHLLLWFNITITTLSNALVGRTLTTADTLYRVICIVIGASCIAYVFI